VIHLDIPNYFGVSSGQQPLKVFTACIKLNNKYPRKHAMQELLYGNEKMTAEGADVIALYLTDLEFNHETTNPQRHLLRNALRDQESYVLNEDDPALPLKYIPAILTSAKEGEARYCSMHVAIHKRNVADIDHDADFDHHDCFPMSPELICKSPRKNDHKPSFKAIIAQEVLLVPPCMEADGLSLFLLGANLDTDDDAKHTQVEALRRYLQHSKRASRHFASIIWGDLNNRLVVTPSLKPHIEELTSTSPGAGATYALKDTGVAHLCELLASDEGRAQLLRTDSLHYTGEDYFGKEFEVPLAHKRLRELFHLHTDIEHPDGVPLPTYKRTPMDGFYGECFGCQTQLKDVMACNKFASGARSPENTPRDLDLEESQSPSRRGVQLTTMMNFTQRALEEVPWYRLNAENVSHNRQDDFAKLYFSWEVDEKDGKPATQTELSVADHTGMAGLRLGWCLGVGVLQQGSVGKPALASIIAFENADSILAYDHVPIRAQVTINP